jgi:hypothetical protein
LASRKYIRENQVVYSISSVIRLAYLRLGQEGAFWERIPLPRLEAPEERGKRF